MSNPEREPPEHAFQAAIFASCIAEMHKRSPGDSQDLFVVYAGLVASRDVRIASECLIALEEAVLASCAMA